jgi:hypothetical protein
VLWSDLRLEFIRSKGVCWTVARHLHLPQPDDVDGRNLRNSVRTIRMVLYHGLELRADA